MTKPHANIRAFAGTHASGVRGFALFVFAVLGILLFAEPALAQCAMCRASLGANSSFLRNFNIGVLVLLVPPVSIFCTIFVIAFRYRKSE